MFSRVFVAAVASLPFVAQLASAATCARTYTVVEGDYCDKISAANNASTYQLAAINFPTVNAGCTNLVPGQEICLGTQGEDCKSTYVVQTDDSCAKITNTFAVNTTILGHNNPQINSDCSNIYVGQVLCVANEGLVPPAPAGVVATSTAAITQTTAAPQATPSPALVASGVASVESAPADSGDDDSGDDDEDLPFCDELDD